AATRQTARIGGGLRAVDVAAVARHARKDRVHAYRRIGTVEAARTEAFRVGVVRHDVVGDVPRQVAAPTVPALGLVQVDREAAQACRGARPVDMVHHEPGAGALAVVLRAVLELIIVVPAN